MNVRVIWDNSGEDSAVRATAERMTDKCYRVTMSCSGRYSVTYGATLRQAWYRGLSYMLTGTFGNLSHRAA